MVRRITILSIPADWKINAYPHVLQVHRIGVWFNKKTFYTCSCGASGRNPQVLYNYHLKSEMDTRAFLARVAKANKEKGKLQRADNRAKYEEFLKNQKQTSTPDSKNFYH